MPRPIRAALLAALLVLPGGSARAAPAEEEEARFLTRVRRLTYAGRRAGEGYFSPDGRQLVFQSERAPGNPFFQIFRMELETGDVQRLSPGAGKTTCAFPRPGRDQVLFSSTHHDPRSAALQEEELARRAAGQERRYAWDFDPEMEIYVWEGAGVGLRRLTAVRGYDAEASYSPDGEWIAFTSTRHAWTEDLAPAERVRSERDPSHFAEIYRMRADGSGTERLTQAPGYDGGPFFFADGSRLVWRRFAPGGAIADLWTMRPDGSEPLRITDFDSMSWAPFPHPSGEYVFFASNVLGFSNFEIFIVDSAGEREPVRVTHAEGFDGLPVPTPQGDGLAWTSTRHGGPGGQLYLADWSHAAARRALAASPRRGAP